MIALCVFKWERSICVNLLRQEDLDMIQTASFHLPPLFQVPQTLWKCNIKSLEYFKVIYQANTPDGFWFQRRKRGNSQLLFRKLCNCRCRTFGVWTFEVTVKWKLELLEYIQVPCSYNRDFNNPLHLTGTVKSGRV